MAIDPQSIFIKKCKEKDMDISAIIEFCKANDPSIAETADGLDEKALAKLLTPKQAKTLLKAVKKLQ